MREIWFLGHCAPPHGGVATFVENLHDNFVRDGIKHNMIIGSKKKRKDMKPLEMNILPYFSQMSGITRNSCVIDSSYVFLEDPTTVDCKKRFAIWNFLVKWKKIRWIKIVHDGTLPYRYKHFGYLEKFVWKYSLKNMASILAVDEAIRKWIVKDVGYKGEVEVIQSILPKKYEERDLSANIKAFIENYKYIIVSVGTCNKEYGFQDIIAAMNLLPEEYQINTGVILLDGNVAAKDKRYMAARQRLSNIRNVLLLYGVDNDMVYSIMKASTVFIRGFFFESYGISRVEAILAGLPVIATNLGETRGMHTYECGDIERLSQLIMQAFKGDIRADEEWIQFYQKVAYENYRKIKKVVMEDT